MSITVEAFPNVPAEDYNVLRSKIRSGDILLCSGTALFSTLIQKASKSIWSHVAFILRLDTIDRIMILESVEPIGVRAVTLSSYVCNYDGTAKGYPGRILLARHAQFDPANIANLSKIAVDLLGHPYDKDEILRIATRLMARATGFEFSPGTIKQDREYICSEYAYECYQSVGININYDPGGFITPADFAKDPYINAINFIKTE